MAGLAPLLEVGGAAREAWMVRPALVGVGALAVACSFCGGFLAGQPGRAGARATALVEQDPLGGVGAPLAKRVVVGMDTNINFHTAWDNWKVWSTEMAPYWTEDLVYDFNYVGPWGFGPQHGLHAWFLGEHMHYNRALPDCQFTDFIRAATNQTCTSASYGLARWTGEFARVPAPANKPWVRVRDLDFYLLEGDRIKVNWCLIDVVDMFMQVGYRVLPPAPMATDGYLAPAAMDGFPAPLSAAVDPETTAASERIWRAAVHEDYVQHFGDAGRWADQMVWYGPGGIGTAHSRQDYLTHFLKPLHAGFSNLTMATDLVVCEGNYCGAHFHLHGIHTGTWLGERATGRNVTIRCGAHARIEKGSIVQGWLIIDLPLAFHGMGVDLFARARDLLGAAAPA